MLTEEQLLQIEERTDDNAQSLNYFCTDLHEDVRRYLKHVDDVRVLLEEIRVLREKVVSLEADKRFLNESVVTAGLIAAHVDHLQADRAQEIRELRERLAAQEPDAKGVGR